MGKPTSNQKKLNRLEVLIRDPLERFISGYAAIEKDLMQDSEGSPTEAGWDRLWDMSQIVVMKSDR